MGSDQMNFKEICTANFTGQHDQNYKNFQNQKNDTSGKDYEN